MISKNPSLTKLELLILLASKTNDFSIFFMKNLIKKVVPHSLTIQKNVTWKQISQHLFNPFNTNKTDFVSMGGTSMLNKNRNDKSRLRLVYQLRTRWIQIKKGYDNSFLECKRNFINSFNFKNMIQIILNILVTFWINRMKKFWKKTCFS